MRCILERSTVGALRRALDGLPDGMHVVFVGGTGDDFGEDIATEVAVSLEYDRPCVVVHLDPADDDGDTPVFEGDDRRLS